MFKRLAVLTLAVVMAACAGDSTGPQDDPTTALLQEMAALAYGMMNVGEPGSGLMDRLGQLPPDLALTAGQLTQINALINGFIAATAADRDALAAIRAEAEAARAAGKTREEVHAILAGGAEIRQRLAAAERALHAAILGVLTPAQRAALSGRTPPPPRPCALSEAQRNEISALRAAWEQTYAAETAVIRSAHERALAARQAGAARAEIEAIIAEARAAMERLTAARATLLEALTGVLTPEQVAAGCMR